MAMYQDILMKLSQQQHVPGLNGASMPPRTPPNAASLMAAAATGNHNLLQNNQNSMHLVSFKGLKAENKLEFSFNSWEKLQIEVVHMEVSDNNRTKIRRKIPNEHHLKVRHHLPQILPLHWLLFKMLTKISSRLRIHQKLLDEVSLISYPLYTVTPILSRMYTAPFAKWDLEW